MARAARAETRAGSSAERDSRARDIPAENIEPS
jgi:hypothetical protein